MRRTFQFRRNRSIGGLFLWALLRSASVRLLALVAASDPVRVHDGTLCVLAKPWPRCHPYRQLACARFCHSAIFSAAVFQSSSMVSKHFSQSAIMTSVIPGSARAYPATGATSHLSHISESVTFMVPHGKLGPPLFELCLDEVCAQWRSPVLRGRGFSGMQSPLPLLELVVQFAQRLPDHSAGHAKGVRREALQAPIRQIAENAGGPPRPR